MAKKNFEERVDDLLASLDNQPSFFFPDDLFIGNQRGSLIAEGEVVRDVSAGLPLGWSLDGSRVVSTQVSPKHLCKSIDIYAADWGVLERSFSIDSLQLTDMDMKFLFSRKGEVYFAKNTALRRFIYKTNKRTGNIDLLFENDDVDMGSVFFRKGSLIFLKGNEVCHFDISSRSLVERMNLTRFFDTPLYASFTSALKGKGNTFLLMGSDDFVTSRFHNLYEYDVLSQSLEKLSDKTFDKNRLYGWHVSPDGSKIAYVLRDWGEKKRKHFSNVRIHMYDISSGADYPLPGQPEKMLSVYGFSWSYNMNYIVYSVNLGDDAGDATILHDLSSGARGSYNKSVRAFVRPKRKVSFW